MPFDPENHLTTHNGQTYFTPEGAQFLLEGFTANEQRETRVETGWREAVDAERNTAGIWKDKCSNRLYSYVTDR